MATKTSIKSVEPNIADLANGWLRAYKLNYKLEQESLNTEIDTALNDYFSKNGGACFPRLCRARTYRTCSGARYPPAPGYPAHTRKSAGYDRPRISCPTAPAPAWRRR